ncbi:MAG: protein kinase [candidate division Zixibacteria bacterium]
MSDLHMSQNDGEDFRPGTELGNYRIVSKIGSGGMGDVYLAEDEKLNRRVALKFLSRQFVTDSTFKERFLREARAAASLSHPNIITVHEVNEFKGRPFIAMEYVESESLKEYIKDKSLAFDKIFDIASQVCRALSEAHEKGLVHRDIKPSNILIDAQGRIKIVDFGLVHAVGETTLSGAGSTMGTISYMSPEQVTGGDISGSSDLFSLGVVLYEMVTGVRPFQGDYEASVIYSIVNETPKAITELRDDVPPHLIDTIDKLLKKNPEERFENASDVVSALKEEGHFELDSTRELDIKISNKNIRIGYLLLAVVIAISAIIYIIGDQKATDMAMGSKKIAVLPFENLGDPSHQYFADGITDEITARLATIQGLKVVSRTSAMRFKDSDQSISSIGKELKVDYLLIGTIRWEQYEESLRVRIIPQLIKVEDDTHIWAGRYFHTLTDIFSVQIDIAENVAKTLNIVMHESGQDALKEIPTHNIEAYDYYLRGNDYFHRSWDHDDILIATQMYQKAVELDPEFSLAHAMLSRGHESLFWEGYDRTEERCGKAREAASRALELQPALPEAHLAMGYIYYHCDMVYGRAIQAFAMVIQKLPNQADAYSSLGAVQRRQGQFEEAINNFKKSFELDPLSNLKAFDIGLTLGLIRNYDEARVYLEKAGALAPDWPLPCIYKAWLDIFSNGDAEKAKIELSKSAHRVDMSRSQYYWWLLRLVEPNLGKILEKTQPGTDAVAFYLHQARIYRLLEQYETEKQFADSALILLAQKENGAGFDARYHSQLSMAYGALRQKDSALYHGQMALELLPTSKDAFDALFLVVNMAEILVIFEEYDVAVERLEHLLTIPGFVSRPYLKIDPLWKPLENHPRFKIIISESE